MKDTVQTALSGRPEHKRSFVPSKLDKLKVGKLVHAIKMGWIKPKKPQENQFQPKFYDIWGQDNDKNKLRFMHNLPAPKLELPGNELSYNPPLEYLLTESEENKLKEDALEDSKIFVAPRKFNSLRLVPTYDDFIKEQFNRCLDMYLCPRQMKMRVCSIYSSLFRSKVFLILSFITLGQNRRGRFITKVTKTEGSSTISIRIVIGI